MKTYEGSCHCGSVSFSFESEEISEGLRCNCSICKRKGAVMTPFLISPEQMHIEAKENALSYYQFGAKVAKHYYCTKCGIYTFHETRRMPGHFRANTGCIDGVDVFSLPVQVFDGASL